MIYRDFAVAIIINDKNEVLLQKKGLDYKWFPCCWALFGGGIEPGESPEQTLKREMKEELNLQLTDFKLLQAREYKIKALNGELFEGKGYYFLIKFNNLSEISISEGKGFAFFDKEELSSLKMNEIDLRALKEYFLI